MAIVSPYISITTLNLHGLSCPIKRYKVAGCIKKKQDSTVCYLQESNFSFKDIHRLIVKGLKENSIQMKKRVVVAILI